MAETEYQRIIAVQIYTQSKNLTVLAEKIGKKRNDLYHYRNSRRPISMKFARMITKVWPEISESWLVYGIGNMLTNEPAAVNEPPAQYGKCPHCDALREALDAQKKLIKMLERDLALCKDDLEKRKVG